MTVKEKIKEHIISGKAKKVLLVIYIIISIIFFANVLSGVHRPAINILLFIIWALCHILTSNYKDISEYLLEKLL